MEQAKAEKLQVEQTLLRRARGAWEAKLSSEEQENFVKSMVREGGAL